MSLAVSTVDLARVQFATTSLYHFLFVPLTLGLAPLVAVMQTIWHRTRNPDWLRLTRFFGTLMLINFAIGVATGLVQEFQFGMNWSIYSKFVGDVFGAPLAIEGLAAFMLESTFLGLWIFGWDRLSPRVHLATAYAFAVGSWLSAYFIIVANSWMQRPVGSTVANGRAELTSVWALLSNRFAVWAYIHVLLVGLTTAAVLIFGVACWHFLRERNQELFRRAAMLALLVGVPVSAVNLAVGSHLGVVITDYQPMKIAAVEAQWDTCQPCAFSIFQIGGFTEEDQTPTFSIQIPHLLSILATDSWNGEVQGMTPLQQEQQDAYGARDLPPARAHDLLGDADHGVPRNARLPRSRGLRLLLPPPDARAEALVAVGGHPHDPAAVHRGTRRLGAERGGSAAVDRAGAPEDGRRQLAERLDGDHRHEPRRPSSPCTPPSSSWTSCSCAATHASIRRSSAARATSSPCPAVSY